MEYIRDSREPLLPFLKVVSLYGTYRPINFIKNFILKCCSWFVAGRFHKIGLEPMYLCGLIMSGRMDKERVGVSMPLFKKTALKRGRVLEVFISSRAGIEIKNLHRSSVKKRQLSFMCLRIVG